MFIQRRFIGIIFITDERPAEEDLIPTVNSGWIELNCLTISFESPLIGIHFNSKLTQYSFNGHVEFIGIILITDQRPAEEDLIPTVNSGWIEFNCI